MSRAGHASLAGKRGVVQLPPLLAFDLQVMTGDLFFTKSMYYEFLAQPRTALPATA